MVSKSHPASQWTKPNSRMQEEQEEIEEVQQKGDARILISSWRELYAQVGYGVNREIMQKAAHWFTPSISEQGSTILQAKRAFELLEQYQIKRAFIFIFVRRNIAVPMRMWVAPALMASSKSLLMPMLSCERWHRFASCASSLK